MNQKLFAQTAPPPQRGRGRGCGAERRQWRMQRGGAPVAVEKIEQASSAKIFSGTARRRGQIRRGYLWSASVRSTDLDFSPQKNPNPYPAQLSVKGVCKGESLVPLCPVLLPFAGAKGRPPRRAVLIKPCKRPCPAEGEMKLYHNYCRQPLSHGCAVPAPLTQGSL